MDPLAHSTGLEASWLQAQGAGLFWLLIEVWILILLGAAHHYARSLHSATALGPLGTVGRLGPHGAAAHRPWLPVKALAFSACTIGLLGLALLSRHAQMELPSRALARLATQPPTQTAATAFEGAYRGYLLETLCVWAVFVAAWVVLEVWIVARGIRLFLTIRRLITPGLHGQTRPKGRLGFDGQNPRAKHVTTGMVIAIVFTILVAGAAAVWFAVGVASPGNHHSSTGTNLDSNFNQAQARSTFPTWEAAYEAVLGNHQVYNDAMGLYLRLAGVVWIAAEWVAAWYLWRGFRLLRGVCLTNRLENGPAREKKGKDDSKENNKEEAKS